MRGLFSLNRKTLSRFTGYKPAVRSAVASYSGLVHLHMFCLFVSPTMKDLAINEGI